MSMRSVIGFSAFLLSVFTLSAVPAGAAETNRDVVTTKDGDYFGFDLRTEQDVTSISANWSVLPTSPARLSPTTLR